MSRAYKCDRCRRLFEVRGMLKNGMTIITGSCGSGGSNIDLCCTCAKEFNAWWENIQIYTEKEKETDGIS